MKSDPLFGILNGLDDMFSDYQFVTAVSSNGVIHYTQPVGWYPLSGLPGSVRPDVSQHLVVKPAKFIVEALQPRCINHALGSFRSVRSAYWMKQGLLPVFAYDADHISNPFIALVPYEEHERFSGR